MMRIFGKELGTSTLIWIVVAIAAIGAAIWYWVRHKDSNNPNEEAAKASQKAASTAASTGTVQAGAKQGFAMSGVGLVFPN